MTTLGLMKGIYPRRRHRVNYMKDEDLDEQLVLRCDKYFPDDDIYFDRMQKILAGYPHYGVPREPSQIIGHLFLGTQADAENFALLKRMRFTHVLNVSALPKKLYPKYGTLNPYKNEKDLDINYEEITAQDDEFANIIKFFSIAFTFFDHAREARGRVLVYSSGVSRSGAICLGYLIRGGMPLLQATKIVKDKRRTALTNTNFMRQLVTYARTRMALDSNPDIIKTREFLGPADKYRMMTTHLPTIQLCPRYMEV